MNILLTADEAAGLRAFRLLNGSSHRVTAVITPEENSAIRNMASQFSIPVSEPENLTDPAFADRIRADNIDVLLNVHLLNIIHPEIINAVSVGGFNLHPGPLPGYAGLNAPSWAIYNRETEYGVTLHWLETGIDTGDIAYQKPVSPDPGDTGLSLSLKCAATGMKLISELLGDLSTGYSAIPRIPQDLSGRRYFQKRDLPQKGRIDWTRTSAEIDAFIRACHYSPFKSPWGFPKTTFNGMDINILSVKLTGDPCGEKPGSIHCNGDEFVRVATSDHWLVINKCSIKDKHVPASTVFNHGDILK
ncbi:MAG: formyltransferase family protein [Balneolaceae bacterium]